MPELILSCGHKEYVCTAISVEMYRRYTEIMERNDSDSISDAFEANTKILMTVFGARPEAIKMAPDRKSTRLNSSHSDRSRMPSSA